MRMILSQRSNGWTTLLLRRLARAALLSGALVSVARAQGATGTVIGRVTDARSGLPLDGVGIQVSDTRLGAVTAEDGRYRVTGVAAGTQVLVARRLGYTAGRQTVTVNAGQETTADFALEPTAIALDAVVVAGTPGGGQRRTIGNAVTTVDAADQLVKSGAPDLTSLLSARVPGAVITMPTGRIGAGPAIQIRGRSSIGLGNSPTVIIDGVVVNNTTGTGPTAVTGGLAGQASAVAGRLNDIAPEDIETIEVIKGPAASTIYGTTASNGVIYITTKRGILGSRPQFSLQASGGPIWFRDAEGRIPTNTAKNTSGEILTWNAVKQEEDRGDPLFETGMTSQVNGSFAGGRTDFRYFVSGLYEKDQGIEPNNSLHQVSLHANLDFQPSDRVNIVTSANYVDLRSHLGVDDGASAMFGAVFGHSVLFPNARGFGLNFVPEITQQLWDNSQKVSRYLGSARIEHNPVSWFDHRFTIGLDHSGDDSRSLERYAPPALAALLPAATAAGRIRQTVRNGDGISANYSGTARLNPTSTVSSETSIGGQFFRLETNISTLGGTGFPGAGIETVGGAAVAEAPTHTILLNTTIGAYVQQKFGWRERVYLTGGLRVDNNSAFGKDFKWVTYPKVDASWVVSDEAFWHWKNTVRSLRLRAAYGQSGRQPATFSALRAFDPVPGPGTSPAVTPATIGNSNLKPERGKEIEAGFEAEVFNRLSLDFTYFNKTTDDLILNQPVAPSTGFPGSRPVNLGRVHNSGIELAANLQVLRWRNLDWQIQGTYATNADEIKDLGGLPSVIAAFGQFNKVGYPIGAIFAKRVVSADRATNGTATNVLCDGGPGQAPVACATAPWLFVGTPTAKRSGAITNSVNVGRNLRFHALVDFKQGYKLLNATALLRCTGGLGAGLCDSNYHPENYSTVYLAQTVGNALAQGIVTHWVEDGSFAKLREVSATYTLPARWVPGASNATFTLAARELATWTGYSGIDPEVSRGGTGTVTATDQALYPPLTRVYATFSVRF